MANRMCKPSKPCKEVNHDDLPYLQRLLHTSAPAPRIAANLLLADLPPQSRACHGPCTQSGAHGRPIGRSRTCCLRQLRARLVQTQKRRPQILLNQMPATGRAPAPLQQKAKTPASKCRASDCHTIHCIDIRLILIYLQIALLRMAVLATVRHGHRHNTQSGET